MATHYIKWGDTSKPIRSQLFNDDGTPVDLTSVATTQLLLKRSGSSSVTTLTGASETPKTSGIVKYQPVTADYSTLVASTYDMDWKLTYNDGTFLFVPTKGHDQLVITAAL